MFFDRKIGKSGPEVVGRLFCDRWIYTDPIYWWSDGRVGGVAI